MSSHPDIDTLALWALDPGEDAAVREHVAGCDRCQSLGERLRRLARLAGEAMETEPPPAVMERAMSLVSGGADVLEAELVEDSAVPVGVRDDGGDGRILTYRAGAFDLHVQMLRWSDGRRTTLLGQLLGEEGDLPGARLRVVSRERMLAETSADEIGEFRMALRLTVPFAFEVESPGVRFRTPSVQAWDPL